jgi:hypothetical protein
MIILRLEVIAHHNRIGCSLSAAKLFNDRLWPKPTNAVSEIRRRNTMYKTLLTIVLVLVLLASVALAAGPPVVATFTGTTTLMGSTQAAPIAPQVVLIAAQSMGTELCALKTPPTDVDTLMTTAMQAPDTPTKIAVATPGTFVGTFTKATDAAPAPISVAMPGIVAVAGTTYSTMAATTPVAPSATTSGAYTFTSAMMATTTPVPGTKVADYTRTPTQAVCSCT